MSYQLFQPPFRLRGPISYHLFLAGEGSGRFALHAVRVALLGVPREGHHVLHRQFLTAVGLEHAQAFGAGAFPL